MEEKIYKSKQKLAYQVLHSIYAALAVSDEKHSCSPTVILKIQGYSIEIANHAARDTILNTLSVLQQLC